MNSDNLDFLSSTSRPERRFRPERESRPAGIGWEQATWLPRRGQGGHRTAWAAVPARGLRWRIASRPREGYCQN